MPYWEATKEPLTETPKTQLNNCTYNAEYFSYFSWSIVLLVCWHTPERGFKCPGAWWRLLSGDRLGLSQSPGLNPSPGCSFASQAGYWEGQLVTLQNPAATHPPSSLLHGSAEAVIISTAPPRLISLCILYPCRIICVYAHSTTNFTSLYEISKNKVWIFSRLQENHWWESGYYRE